MYNTLGFSTEFKFLAALINKIRIVLSFPNIN